MKNSGSSGQTIIEVIVAVSLIVLVLTTLVSGIALSVRNSRQAKNQALAKELVRQATEWIRGVRDSEGWETLRQTIRDDGNGTNRYCLPALPSTLAQFAAIPTVAAITNCTPITGTEFSRMIELTVNGPGDQIQAVATVQWGTGAKVFSSKSQLNLYKY